MYVATADLPARALKYNIFSYILSFFITSAGGHSTGTLKYFATLCIYALVKKKIPGDA